MKLEIADSFYQEEERCGYVVSEHMKKVWAVELDLLYQLQQVCEKYGIQTSTICSAPTRMNSKIPISSRSARPTMAISEATHRSATPIQQVCWSTK